jgi:hypothetical protein
MDNWNISQVTWRKNQFSLYTELSEAIGHFDYKGTAHEKRKKGSAKVIKIVKHVFLKFNIENGSHEIFAAAGFIFSMFLTYHNYNAYKRAIYQYKSIIFKRIKSICIFIY